MTFCGSVTPSERDWVPDVAPALPRSESTGSRSQVHRALKSFALQSEDQVFVPAPEHGAPGHHLGHRDVPRGVLSAPVPWLQHHPSKEDLHGGSLQGCAKALGRATAPNPLQEQKEGAVGQR